MAVYGRSIYGQEFYGYDIPPAFRVDPFVASPVDYGTISVSWGQPAGTILAYRLIKNRFGFPTDQDDGEVLIDSLSYPGSSFVDTDIIPGEYHYYAFYVLLNFQGDQWVRSAQSACLMPFNYASGLQLSNLIPAFYHTETDSSNVIDIFAEDFPSTDLDFFCNVLGWGIDYLKTQYDTYLHVNDPWKIPLTDLLNLAEQLGLNINPDIHPYTLRKAVYFNATVNQQRGTLTGIDQELEILTGYAADIQISQNFMLENDQSMPLSPQNVQWSPYIEYLTNEVVTYNNFNYIRTSASNGIGQTPSGTSANNTWWNSRINVSTSTLTNPATSGPNTWEVVWPGSATGQAGNFMGEVNGLPDPVTLTGNIHAGFSFQNATGGTSNFLLRSVSRVPGDFTTNSPGFPPNRDQVVKDGIPVPSSFANTLVWNGTTWNSTERYNTQEVVWANNVPFIALRASTNVQPPAFTVGQRSTANNEWMPISLEPRFRLCVSGYFQGSTTGMTVTPFVEWYDASGNYITRILARTSANNGTVAAPQSITYDSFTYVSGATVGGRKTDDGQLTWTARQGVFQVSPFSDGCVFPQVSSQRTYATVNSGASNCTVGITFITNPPSGDVQGLILRWQDDNNYLRATMSELDLKTAGVFTNLGTYSTAANPGDRLTVVLNGSTITCFVNNVQVLQVTNSFNTSGQNHGIIEEGGIVVTNPGAQSNTIGIAI